jgi:hypothetical protein
MQQPITPHYPCHTYYMRPAADNGIFCILVDIPIGIERRMRNPTSSVKVEVHIPWAQVLLLPEDWPERHISA